MPIKIQYPVQLNPETKCPSCNQPISTIGPNLYACHTGHVLEALVLVTMRPKTNKPPVEVGAVKSGSITSDEPLVPSYDNKKVTKQ